MEYKDIDSKNKKLLAEIKKIKDFQNLNEHLPQGSYRYYFEEFKKKGWKDALRLMGKYQRMWTAIDNFIQTHEFDFNSYLANLKNGEEARAKAQTYLYPLYIHLRKKGFSIEEICGSD
jgi:hypothetical protein